MIIDELIQSGKSAIESGDWNGAHQSWVKILKQEPNHEWAKVKLGKILMELNRFEEAEELLIEDAEQYPNRPYALLHLAKIAQLQGCWPVAKNRWERLLSRFPNYEWALQPYANTLKQLGELNKAERFYHMDVALHPAHFPSHLALIEIALKKEQFQLSRQRIEQFVKNYPKKRSLVREYQARLQKIKTETKLEDYININSWEKSKWRFRFTDQHRFLYSPVPKVASSTLAKSLYKLTQGKRPPKGTTSKEASNVFANQDAPNDVLMCQLKSILIRGDYFTFSFVRNPYTRILSAFLDKILKAHQIDYRSPLNLHSVGTEEVTFLDFLQQVQHVDFSRLDPHFRPQWHLLGCDKLMKFGFIGRFENLEEDLQFTLGRINKNTTNKKIISKRSHATNAAEKLKQYYGAEEQALVAKIYADDFKYFGYGLALPIF